jgi:glucose-6-phosphate 1-epimerase
MRKLLLTHPSGSSAEIYLSGAQVTSWIVQGRQRLFVSEKAVFDPGKPIRGGIPIVFPQFADSGPLPKHGWLRTTEWSVGSHEGPATVTLRTEETPDSLSIWPHTYEAHARVHLDERALEVTLTIRNPGAEAFSFTSALHSYLAVDDITKTSVLGLYGLPYIDKTANRAVMYDTDPAVIVRSEMDRVYTGAPRLVQLVDGGSSLRVSSTGFCDIVIWNPWADVAKSIADMDDADYVKFICIEAAIAEDPCILKPGETWQGTQRLEASL